MARRFHMTHTIVMFLSCLLALPCGLAAADAEITAQVDRQILYQGESFVFSITVSGPARGVESPMLPEMEHFLLMGTSSSSNFSFSNGQAHSSKKFSYTLVPDGDGMLELPAVPVRVKGKTYYSKSIRVNVRPTRQGASGQQNQRITPGGPGAARRGNPGRASDEAGEGDRNVFIRSWVDSEEVYVGQQLTHHFGLFRNPRVSFMGTPQYSAPEMQGFWTEPLGDEISGYRKFEGMDYAVTELRTALFPSDPGNKVIGPATVSVRMRDRNSWGFFSFDGGPERVLRSPEIKVLVKPLPTAGRPVDFSGLVASGLRLDSSVERGPYEVGQPITLTIGLAGAGNPRAFKVPELPSGDDFKLYEPELESETSVDENSVRVRKRWTIVLVPRRAGRLTIPGVAYNWFDPRRGEYRDKRTEDFTIDVAASSSEQTNPVVFSDLTPERVELLGRDIHHIKTEPVFAGDGSRFPRSGLFWLSLLPPLPLLLGALIWRRRQDLRLADRAGTRARGARKLAAQRLKAAAGARDGGDFDRFCLELTAGLRGYLADRLDSSAAGLTEDSIDGGLAELGVSESGRKKLRKLMAKIDFARYAPGHERGAMMAQLYESGERTLRDLETKIRAGRKQGGGMLASLLQLLGISLPTLLLRAVSGMLRLTPLLLTLALIALPLDAGRAVGDDASRMSEASAFYESGDFVQASFIWTALDHEGLADSHLYYNLGNAHYQRGRLGEAVRAYRLALRLAPRDQEIRDNLELARSHCADSDAALADGFPERFWTGLRSRVAPGELAAVGVILLWLLTTLLLLGILRRVSWQGLRVWLIIVVVLLPLTWSAMIASEWQDWNGRDAVLIVPVVAVQSGPGEDYITLFEMHEGAELSMREMRGAWVRVSMSDELEGWIPVSALLTL